MAKENLQVNILFRDVISSQQPPFLAGYCSKINQLLKVSK